METATPFTPIISIPVGCPRGFLMSLICVAALAAPVHASLPKNGGPSTPEVESGHLSEQMQLPMSPSVNLNQSSSISPSPDYFRRSESTESNAANTEGESPTPRGPGSSACNRVLQVITYSDPEIPTYGNSYSAAPVITPDGRFVAFQSFSDNLVTPDTNTVSDIFVFDRLTRQMENVHRNAAGDQANDYAYAPSGLSPDGRFVMFTSQATNLVSGASGTQVYLRDRVQNTVELVSIGTDGNPANNWAFAQAMTSDSRYVTFYSSASNIVSGDTNGRYDVFRRDRLTGQTICCSVGLNGAQSNGDSGYSPIGPPLPRATVMSADGNLIAFCSAATNLVVGDTNNVRDVFLFDCNTGSTERISVNSTGQQANGPSGVAPQNPRAYQRSIDMTPDGRFVAFSSQATNLAPASSDGSLENVFIRDRQSGQTVRIPVPGNATERGSCNPVLSPDGRYVAMATDVKNVVPQQHAQSTQDYLWYDRQTGTIRLVNMNAQSQGGRGENISLAGPTMTPDGRYVAFGTSAKNLVTPEPPTSSMQIFVRDMLPRDCNGNGTIDACDPGWLDLTVFINALLASPQDPAMVCAYDFNRNGQLNGLDVAPFTTELMNPY